LTDSEREDRVGEVSFDRERDGDDEELWRIGFTRSFCRGHRFWSTDGQSSIGEREGENSGDEKFGSSVDERGVAGPLL